MSFSVLEYENNRNLYPIQETMKQHLQLAQSRQEGDEAFRQRAEELEHNGLKAIDSDQLLNCSYYSTASVT